MESVLIICSAENSQHILKNLLRMEGISNPTIVSSGSEAKRLLLDYSFDLIIINAPLSDEFGYELALEVSNSTMSGILMIVKNDLADEISSKVEDYGIFVIPKPISRPLFFQSLRFIRASRIRLAGLKKENNELCLKIEEIKKINRAKCLLIQYLDLTEAQAHKYIEKQAMNQRKSRLQIADWIIKTYGG